MSKKSPIIVLGIITMGLLVIGGVLINKEKPSMDGIVVSEELLKAIAAVESNTNSSAIGDNGKAVGAFQIWQIFVDDVNRIYKTQYTYEDRKDYNRSKNMVRLYLQHYGKRYEQLTGQKATAEVLARIHNSGPNGWKNPKTIVYWRKVKSKLVP